MLNTFEFNNNLMEMKQILPKYLYLTVVEHLYKSILLGNNPTKFQSNYVLGPIHQSLLSMTIWNCTLN